ncbi:DUF2304 domain-containing protein [Patescibacteria group bacterium]|nr:DUF2304 domain-containing protein [Patescibacteria group bacterium]MBU1421168.1 DUF2304 domain-containing protein [Patescibacteria group bacterium]MBU2415871.1 DUF2304 domain-containing protein [Patescibacteria group bacterium]
MFQQIIALIIIIFFISKLFWQKKKQQIKRNEFIFWIIFWALSGIAVLFLKKIDQLVSNLGFSSSGIDILFYIAVIILFYFILKLRLKFEKMNKNITKIVREIALKNAKIKIQNDN